MKVRVVAHSRVFNRYGVLVTFQPLGRGHLRITKAWCCDEDLPRLGSVWHIDTKTFA